MKLFMGHAILDFWLLPLKFGSRHSVCKKIVCYPFPFVEAREDPPAKEENEQGAGKASVVASSNVSARFSSFLSAFAGTCEPFAASHRAKEG